MRNLCIIPARGGSKRIPRKNIKDFLGKPIIAYSIKAALGSNVFEEVMVSTDSPSIARIAREYGAAVPFYRSNKNSDDFSTLSDVLIEVIREYQNKGTEYDNICCILPTAPFITNAKIIKGYKKLTSEKLDTVFPIIEFSYPIQRCLVLNNKKVELVWSEYRNSRSQDLPKRFHDTGQFYWIKTKNFLREEKLFTANSGGILVTELEAQDIDSEQDWKLAELKYKLILGRGKEDYL